MSDVSPQLANCYKLADEFYNRRNEIEIRITELRCEQVEIGNLYDQVVARARDLELQATEAKENLWLNICGTL